MFFSEIWEEVEEGCCASGICEPWQAESVLDSGEQRIVIARRRSPHFHRKLGDGDERNATTPDPMSTAASNASRIIESDKKNRSIGEGGGINNCGYRLGKKGCVDAVAAPGVIGIEAATLIVTNTERFTPNHG